MSNRVDILSKKLEAHLEIAIQQLLAEVCELERRCDENLEMIADEYASVYNNLGKSPILGEMNGALEDGIVNAESGGVEGIFDGCDLRSQCFAIKNFEAEILRKNDSIRKQIAGLKVKIQLTIDELTLQKQKTAQYESFYEIHDKVLKKSHDVRKARRLEQAWVLKSLKCTSEDII